MSTEFVNLYIQGIERAGQKFREKVERARTKWKERATSEDAEIRYAIGVVEAAKDKRRMKALEKVSPEEWAKLAAEGYNRFATDRARLEQAARKWQQNAMPYVNVVQEIAKMIHDAGITGPEAAKFWAEVVVPALAKYRGKPEEVSRVIDEVRAKLEEYKRIAKSELRTKLQQAVNELLSSLGA